MSLLSIYDWYEEFRPYPEIFSGGCGLFTRQGIAKAGFYAIELLSRMGTDRLAQGDGYFISSDKKRFKYICTIMCIIISCIVMPHVFL